jgi:Pretoxin HINT domain
LDGVSYGGFSNVVLKGLGLDKYINKCAVSYQLGEISSIVSPDILSFVSKAYEGLKALSKGCSFCADTPMLTEAGEKPIAEIKEGDRVYAFNEETGEVGLYTVTAILADTDLAIEYLTIDGEMFETTPNHPFYTEQRGWQRADTLQIGEKIRKADGNYGSVEVVEVVQKQQVMYNLTVDTAHTFFVGKQHLLVHNNCIVPHPNQRAAKRAAFREANIPLSGGGINTPPDRLIELRPGSRSPQGNPGIRSEWDGPTGAIVHHDPYGNNYPDANPPTFIGPHYGVEFPDGRPERHHTYPSPHDPRNNR